SRKLALRNPGFPSPCLAFSPDGQRLATGEYSGISLWSVPDGELQTRLTGNKVSIDTLAFSPDSRLLAGIDLEDTLHLCEVPTGRRVRTVERYAGGLQRFDISSDLRKVDGIHRIEISPDFRLVVELPWDHTLQLRDFPDGARERTLAGHTDVVVCLAFDPSCR